MQKFSLNRRLVIIIVCVIVSFALMTVSVTLRNKKSTPPLVQQFGNDIVGLVDRVVAIPTNGLSGSVSAVSELLNTYQENQQLKKQVSELAQTKVRDQTLAKENKQLKKEMKLNASLTDYTAVSAAVITRTPSSWQSQVIINKGAAAGVKKNMPVMSGSGLIGRVAEVNKTNSKVELITDNNDSANRFAVQITTKSGKTVNGVLSGYKATTGQITMDNITTKAKLAKGDKVVTSGLGGVTPKGLYVGTVAKATGSDYGLATKLYINPATDLSALNIVTVAVSKQ
ncbi:MAG: rod shape-determining protein MreC [Levilactobacillus sp.]|jgi:rod shape-determining protein MreC|uniref:Cell shape-determining protein MreC n=1 Tax=Levilactobacillus suantsaiihabitans TaxID=2487722 RepID=A0A4Z0J942_9LACO|nr:MULTISPECIES: rod shape-determining protein MreC [Levilactobacillus]MCH4124299.1 rod shape-determining protein MreC [Levilactobacillus sp.]MCI1554268.1 rod shape-determining protein MreC [Levilactobacillus sp.]MCI1598852.1 rod shape-determining protein MreC [Levilactobacillus sp.]MCI1606851.1 rod shape-determining protein MreC [Levilactobacillus sp.]TGD19244.1 rod shape-determining protein MreC [Levilactobacillus suantsaiihabitans]